MENTINLRSIETRSLGSSLFECVTIEPDNTSKISAPNSEAPNIMLQAGAICICLRGGGEFLINNTHHKVVKGDMLTLLPNTIIGNVASSDDFIGYTIGINTNYLMNIQMSDIVKSYVTIMNSPILNLKDDQVQTIIELCEMLKHKREQTSHPFAEEICKSLLSILCYEIHAIYKQRLQLEHHPRTRQGALCQEFLSLVEKHATEHREMGFYADKLCITPKYLSVVIRKASGRSPAEWINRTVLLYAKTLLTSSDMTVQQISAELNFPNPSFFGQYFKRHEGCTPKHYRNQSRKN